MFDPTYPPTNAEIESAPLRGNFNGLKALIDALAALAVNGALVESVGTGNAGDPASAGVSLVNGVLRFSFVLPRGETGAAGQDGQPGPIGPQGAPFANAIIDSVTTLNAGENATVSVSFDGSNVRFSFGLPRGNDGSQGTQGFQGPPGEVTNSDLNNALSAAITGTSSNSNAVSTLGQTAAGSYDAAQLQMLFDKMDELIAALRR